jgi:hypothetical protein
MRPSASRTRDIRRGTRPSRVSLLEYWEEKAPTAAESGDPLRIFDNVAVEGAASRRHVIYGRSSRGARETVRSLRKKKTK